MKTIFTLLLFILFFSSVAAQEEFVDAPSEELTTIPFIQYTGGVIVFKALLDNFKDTLSFVLDSGSGGISLDSTTVQDLGMKQPEPERIIRGVGGTRKVGFLKNSKLTINSLVVDSLNFHVVDYAILSALYGQRIDGIAGYSLLSRYILKINYENRTITFCSNGLIRYPKGGYILTPRINMLPYLPARIKDKSAHLFNYLFDIGAGLTVLASKDYMDDTAFLKKKRKMYLKQGEGLGGKVQMYISVMKELKIGPYRFRNVPINIFDDTYNITSYPILGGLIGNDIFRRFNCILNYKRRQFYITPNKFYNELFDYAYSGIELYMIDGKAVIGDIPKGSPADKAGLVAGDEVIAVNNKFGMTLDDLKQALQSTYGAVRIIIRRGEELVEKKMSVINIINGKAISNQTLPNTFRDGIIIKTQNDPFKRDEPRAY